MRGGTLDLHCAWQIKCFLEFCDLFDRDAEEYHGFLGVCQCSWKDKN